MKKNRLPSEIRDTIKDIFDYFVNMKNQSNLEIAIEKADMLLFGYWGGKFYDNLRFIIRTSYPYRLITENDLYVTIGSKIYFALKYYDEKLSKNSLYWKLKQHKNDVINSIIKFLKTIVFVILVLFILFLINRFNYL